MLRCAGCFAIWSVWTLLGSALCLQVWIASRHELTLPAPVLRLAERHLSSEAAQVSLGKVTFDPSGHLVVQDVAVKLAGFDEPALRVALVQTRLDPWGLLAGHAEAQQLEVSGAELLYPSPLSPTGRVEPCVSNLVAVVQLGDRQVHIEELSGRLGSATFSARGDVLLAPFLHKAPGKPPLTLARAAQAYVDALRKFSPHAARLDALQDARLDVTLIPSSAAGAIADIELTGSQLKLTSPRPVEASALSLSTRLPLAGAVSARVGIALDAGRFGTPWVSGTELHARVAATWNPSTRAFVPISAEVASGRIRVKDIDVDGPQLRLVPGPLPLVRFGAVASVAGSVFGASGTIQARERSGTVDFDAIVGQGLVDLAARKVGRDLRRFIIFGPDAHATGRLTLLPGGKLGRVDGWVEASDFTAHSVALDHVAGRVHFDGSRFVGDNAALTQGENVARGSYEMDVRTLDFRFLLSGRLRPMDIEGWFKPWWPALWKSFDFKAAAPDANVDVQGRWRHPDQTRVFVGVDAARPAVRGVAFERVRTRLVVLGHLVHALSIDGVRPEGELSGWFSRVYDPATKSWRSIDFDMTTHVDLADCARMLTGIGPELLKPYSFEKPPELRAWGHIDGPAAPGGPGHNVEFRLSSPGTFKVNAFPLQNVSFAGRWVDKTVQLDWAKADFGGGHAEASVTVRPDGQHRRVDVAGSLKGAKLGEVVNSVESYIELKKPGAVVAKASTAERMSNARLDIDLKASGLLGDPYSFKGSGTAQLSGPEIGQVRLLGGLSRLLRFTSLRFTNVDARFNIEGPDIVFPSLRVTGRNSAIDAGGKYSLRTKTLDFNAKVWPFEQSEGLVRGTVGLVLSPLTVFLEVKLGGSLADPTWSFLYSPFRMLTAPEPPARPPLAPTSPNATREGTPPPPTR